jgi:hypothetical protein
MAQYISLREYGRRKGCSDTAIRKAIKSGKIINGVIRKPGERPVIDPVVADAEWGMNFNPAFGDKSGKLHQKLEAGVNKGTYAGGEGDSGRSLAEIKRQTAEVKLRLDALELKERMGQLVDKDAVYRSLFSAGQEVRTALQAIPDRVIDDVLAARSRNEAHQVLYNAIADALEMLTEISERPITK